MDKLDSTAAPLVLFDGQCNLCSGAVRWIVARDRRARFRFASLQSRAALRALEAAGARGALPDSVVLIHGGAVKTRSDAALAIARELGAPWSCAAAARVLPRGVRDGLYDWIARKRYAWFGRRESCMVPTAQLRERFLDADEASLTR